MQVLLTFALENEFAPWRRLRAFRKLAGQPYSMYEARIGGADARVVLTGVGPENARRVLRQALEVLPDFCISSGLAGSLRRTHRRGAILAAEVVREVHGHRLVESDAALVELACEQGARRTEMFCTASEIVVTSETKRRLGLSADAVEMESFAVMAEAAARSVRAVAIRAISDLVDEDLPLDFNRVLNAHGGIQYSRVVGQLFRAPHRLPALMRLSGESRRAAMSLARFLDSYIESLSASEMFLKNDHREEVAEVSAV